MQKYLSENEIEELGGELDSYFGTLEQHANKGCLELTDLVLAQEYYNSIPKNAPALREEFSERLSQLQAKSGDQYVMCAICNKSVLRRNLASHEQTMTHGKLKRISVIYAKIANTDNVDRLHELWFEDDVSMLRESIAEEFDLVASSVVDNIADSDALNVELDVSCEVEDLRGDVSLDAILGSDYNSGEFSFLIDPYLVDSVRPVTLEANTRGAVYDDILTRTYLTFFGQYHGKPFSKSLMSALLQIASKREFIGINCAPNLYYLEKSEPLFSPVLPVCLKKLQSGECHYFDLENLLSFCLAEDFFTQNWVYSSRESPEYHISKGAGWKLYEHYFQSELKERKLLVLSIFSDEYRKSLKKKKLINCYYLRIDNSYEPDSFRAFPFSVVDSSVDVLDFQEQIIQPFIEKLESGLFKCYFKPTDREEAFVGSLNLVIGDHEGVRKEMGLVSPRCQFGVDIVLACDTKSIGTLYECTPSQLFALVRNNCDALKLVLQAKFASSNTKRKEILSKLGLESVSPYWKLKFFSQQFFFSIFPLPPAQRASWACKKRSKLPWRFVGLEMVSRVQSVHCQKVVSESEACVRPRKGHWL